jgi:molecular chaperone DnaK
VERMRKDAEVHAEEDRKRKELIEVRNTADNAVYTSEKALRDLGDKVPADVRSRVEESAAKVREVLQGDNVEEIRKATEDLMQVVQQIGAAAYQQQGGSAEPPPPPPDEGDSGDEDVVDGEFRSAP